MKMIILISRYEIYLSNFFHQESSDIAVRCAQECRFCLIYSCARERSSVILLNFYICIYMYIELDLIRIIAPRYMKISFRNVEERKEIENRALLSVDD